MRFVHSGTEKLSGLYRITNTRSGRVYVGQAQRLGARHRQHKSALALGKHSNPFMQNDYNKSKQEFGDVRFEFAVVEITTCSKQELNAKEEALIASVYDDQVNCYNMHRKAMAERSCYSHTPEETRRRQCGKVMPPEVRAKLRAASTGNKNRLGYKSSAEARKNMSAAGHTRRPPTDEQRAARSASSMGAGNQFFGKKHTDEARAKMSAGMKGRVPWNKKQAEP